MPNNKQPQTKTNGSNKRNLKKHHIDAIMLRLSGMTHKQIAEKLKFEEITIRQWFMEGGTCYDLYQEELAKYQAYLDKELEGVKATLKEGALLAARKLVEAVAAKGTWPSTIIAAKDLLDRTGFKPTEKLQHANDPDNPINTGTVVVYIPDNGRDTKPNNN